MPRTTDPTPVNALHTHPVPVTTAVCPCCGGTGKLRISGQRSRTCLHCLGQGCVVSSTTVPGAPGAADDRCSG